MPRPLLRRVSLLASAVTIGVLGATGFAGAAPMPSCFEHRSPGPDGTITVQTTSRSIAWGVSMSPPSKSVGVWKLSTYVDGKRTSSGFNRVIPDRPYIPHGTVPASEVGLGRSSRCEG